jgi:chromosome segregation ATPase
MMKTTSSCLLLRLIFNRVTEQDYETLKTKFEQQINTLQKNLNELLTTKSNNESEINIMKSVYEDKIFLLKESINEKDIKINQLQEQIETRHSQAPVVLNVPNPLNQELEEEISKLTKDNEELRQQLSKSKVELEQFVITSQNVITKKNAKIEKLKTADVESNEKDNRINELSQALKKSNTKCERLQHRIREMKSMQDEDLEEIIGSQNSYISQDDENASQDSILVDEDGDEDIEDEDVEHEEEDFEEEQPPKKKLRLRKISAPCYLDNCEDATAGQCQECRQRFCEEHLVKCGGCEEQWCVQCLDQLSVQKCDECENHFMEECYKRVKSVDSKYHDIEKVGNAIEFFKICEHCIKQKKGNLDDSMVK